MIVLLGTGHVFDLRRRIQEEVFKRGPEVVALELDPNRYRSLRAPDQGDAGGPWVYRILARFQKRLAETYGVQAGDEMLAAADAAQDLQVPVALVDQDAQRMFQRLWSEMGWMEKARFVGSSLASLVVPSDSVEDQLDEIQEDYEAYFAILGERYPTMKRVLLDERNRHMAERLDALGRRHELVVAVLGDGHVDGVARLLRERDHEVEALRLKQLREDPAGEADGGASATWSVEVEGPPASATPPGDGEDDQASSNNRS